MSKTFLGHLVRSFFRLPVIQELTVSGKKKSAVAKQVRMIQLPVVMMGTEEVVGLITFDVDNVKLFPQDGNFYLRPGLDDHGTIIAFGVQEVKSKEAKNVVADKAPAKTKKQK